MWCLKFKQILTQKWSTYHFELTKMNGAMKLIFWKLHRLLFYRKSALEPKTKLNADDCLVIVSILGQILLHRQQPSLSWLRALYLSACVAVSLYIKPDMLCWFGVCKCVQHRLLWICQPAKTRKMIKFRYFLWFIRLVSLSPPQFSYLSIYLFVYLSLFSLFVLPYEKC